MSSVKIIFDPAASGLSVVNNAAAYLCSFVGAVDCNGGVVDLTGFSFGAVVSIDGETALEHSYPPEGVQCVSTDQDVLFAENLKPFPADSECHVAAWAEVSGTRVEEQLTFTIPRPSQPFSSWSWDGTKWAPPVPFPLDDDDNEYEWNEDQGTWDLVST